MHPPAWQSNKAILLYFIENYFQELIQCQGTKARVSFKGMMQSKNNGQDSKKSYQLKATYLKLALNSHMILTLLRNVLNN